MIKLQTYALVRLRDDTGKVVDARIEPSEYGGFVRAIDAQQAISEAYNKAHKDFTDKYTTHRVLDLEELLDDIDVIMSKYRKNNE